MMNERIKLLICLWFQKYNSTDFKDSNAMKRVENIMSDCQKNSAYDDRILKLTKAAREQAEQIEERILKEYKLIMKKTIHSSPQGK